jgi:hypothetical protein
MTKLSGLVLIVVVVVAVIDAKSIETFGNTCIPLSEIKVSLKIKSKVKLNNFFI